MAFVVQVLLKATVIVLETFLMNVAYVVEAELLKALVIVMETFLMNVAFVEEITVLAPDVLTLLLTITILLL